MMSNRAGSMTNITRPALTICEVTTFTSRTCPSTGAETAWTAATGGAGVKLGDGEGDGEAAGDVVAVGLTTGLGEGELTMGGSVCVRLARVVPAVTWSPGWTAIDVMVPAIGDRISWSGSLTTRPSSRITRFTVPTVASTVVGPAPGVAPAEAA